MNITPILEAVISLVVALITAFVIPWLKQKTTAQQRQTLLQIVDIAVTAVEQYGETQGWGGEAKKAKVLEYLQTKGYTVDTELDYYIESAVLKLHNELSTAE